MQVIEPKSDQEWAKYYQLRWKLLRKPLGFDRGSEKDDLEDVSIHRAK